MGGFGSGEHFRSIYYRHTIEECYVIKLCNLELRKKLKEVNPEQYWSEIVINHIKRPPIEIKARFEIVTAGNYLLIETGYRIDKIYVSLDQSTNGTTKLIFHCPRCKKRVNKLFLAPPLFDFWKCRNCHDLTYSTSKYSARPSKMERLIAFQIGVSVKQLNDAIKYNYRADKYLNNFTEQIFTEETKMIATSLKLSKRQIKDLDQLSRESGLPKSELIRRAIDLFIEKEKLTAVQLTGLK